MESSATLNTYFCKARDTMLKRIFIFVLINFLIVLTISTLLQVFHVGPYLTAYGLDMKTLAIFCLIWGMAGAFISLMLSKKLAKWTMGVKIIDDSTANPDHIMIKRMVEQLSQKAGLPDIPEVGIFNHPSPNAFATGPSKRRSLVAVSTGLLENLTKEEIEAVIGHEITHIANGDMVTMTLLQGVVNAFVMFLARILAYVISTAGSSRNSNQSGRDSFSYGTYMVCTFLFEIVFMILGSMVVAYFSRRREFKADKGSSDLLGKEPMINALKKLQTIDLRGRKLTKTPESISALLIAAPPKRAKFIELFASHPRIEDRIAKLRST